MISIDNSWLFQKLLHSSLEVQKLFYTSFVTVISLVLMRGATLSVNNGLFQELEFEHLAACLVVFFIASIFWFASSILYTLNVPEEVQLFSSVHEYILQRADLTAKIEGLNAESEDSNAENLGGKPETNWNAVEDFMVDNWDYNVHKDGERVRRAMLLTEGIALLAYLTGVVLFVQCIYPFLCRLAQAVWLS